MTDADVIRLPVRRSRSEQERRDAIVREAEAVMRKVREHQRRGWSHIRLGAFDALGAAVDVEVQS